MGRMFALLSALLFTEAAAAQDACKDDRQKLGKERYDVARFAFEHLVYTLPVTHSAGSVRTNCFEHWSFEESKDEGEPSYAQPRVYTLEGIVFYRDGTGLQRSQRFAVRVLTDWWVRTSEVKSLYLEPR